jgi:hypothetical protein
VNKNEKSEMKGEPLGKQVERIFDMRKCSYMKEPSALLNVSASINLSHSM